MFDFLKRKKKASFPPVPEWRPAIGQPLDRIIERFAYLSDGKRDFAVFANGTCAIVPDGLSDADAQKAAVEVLRAIFYAHPDMNPVHTDDGNILVQYNHPAFNIVLSDVVKAHWAEIDRDHQKALATSEVLITPLGQNVFDDLGKAALFGRCFMFMDAQDPKVVRIVRKTQ